MQLLISVFGFKRVWSLRSHIQTTKTCCNFCLIIFCIVIACIFVRSVTFSQKSILFAVALFMKYKWVFFVWWYLFLSHCRAGILFKWRFFPPCLQNSIFFVTRVALHLHKNEGRSILISWCCSFLISATTHVESWLSRQLSRFFSKYVF
jgi:hypothetical protein